MRNFDLERNLKCFNNCSSLKHRITEDQVQKDHPELKAIGCCSQLFGDTLWFSLVKFQYLFVRLIAEIESLQKRVWRCVIRVYFMAPIRRALYVPQKLSFTKVNSAHSQFTISEHVTVI